MQWNNVSYPVNCISNKAQCRKFSSRLEKGSRCQSGVDKYSGSIPYMGKCTNKVIKAFKKVDVNVGIEKQPTNGEADHSVMTRPRRRAELA